MQKKTAKNVEVKLLAGDNLKNFFKEKRFKKSSARRKLSNQATYKTFTSFNGFKRRKCSLSSWSRIKSC